MAYMVFQQYTTAIADEYRDDPEAEGRLAEAIEFRRWLQGLRLDPRLRDPLVEQVTAIEEGFRRAARLP